MYHFSFIIVVCEILKLICCLYKYMLYLSHGKAKEKRKKKKKRGSSPSARALGTRGRIKLKKRPGAFPECLGIWHSGKGKIKKRQEPSPSAWASGTRGRVN
jgi:hypothetical protein